ncbi:WbqC family protein [Segatella maculosa]|uniref:WbqC family protein n=1 Tax=Segatella maculosa TaxID=439703 RepID=UPI00248FD994|nr:WbqC family protein [Segatella maculosa]
MKTALLSSAYFGPVQWYQKLHRYDRCLIEQHDNFVKQTYRSRCIIPTTNGIQALSIPVSCPQGSQLSKTPMRDVRISDHGNWRHIHWNALCSAYGESPFFDYYQDDLRPFFERKWTFLFDFNMEIILKMVELLDIRPKISLTTAFLSDASMAENATENSLVDDFRDIIRPKHPGLDSDFMARPYYQVYQQKHGFQPNMSILDLLFNEGNEAILWL